MEERWLPVEGYGGLYEVSNLGRVRSLITNRILAAHGQRYNQVVLCKNNNKKNMLVHRLVAKSFLENPLNYELINHKNGVRKDNHMDNLEWCNLSQNIIHAYRTGLNKKSKKVIRSDGTIYPSLHEAARQNNVTQMSIWSVCKKRKRRCNGFGFEYLKEVQNG